MVPHKVIVLCFPFMFLYIDVINCNESELLVNTTSGHVQGFYIHTFNGKVVSAYFGIPYAAPPVDDLRFKPPQPEIRYESTIDGTTKGHSCLQMLRESDDFPTPWLPKKNDTSENCLFLNIWVPNPRPENAVVMVFIHGGGFVAGTSSSENYDGRIMASENNVIIVSLNYRLDVFGFLSLGTGDIPGNVGIMDQAMALRWVQQNIAQFGGDNQKITIFGASAGSGSVGLHLVIPSSWDLFKRGILESGTATSNWCTSSKQRASEMADVFVQLAGCSSENKVEVASCLKQKNGFDLIKWSSKVPPGSGSISAFSPVIDGHYLPDEPLKLLQKGRVKKGTQILLGLAKQDGLIMPLAAGLLNFTGDSNVSSEEFLTYVKSTIGTKNDLAAETVKFMYTDWAVEPAITNWKLAIVDFATDWYFTCSANNFGDYESGLGNSVYRYRVDHKPSINTFMPEWTSASHCDEIGFVFGWPLDKTYNYTEEEAVYSRTIMNYWTQFSKHGDPNMNGETSWPHYSKTDKNVQILDLVVTTQKGYQLQQCAFFENLLPKLLMA